MSDDALYYKGVSRLAYLGYFGGGVAGAALMQAGHQYGFGSAPAPPWMYLIAGLIALIATPFLIERLEPTAQTVAESLEEYREVYE